jgi:hypothetical protein
MRRALRMAQTHRHALGGSDSKSEPGHDEDPLTAERSPGRA